MLVPSFNSTITIIAAITLIRVYYLWIGTFGVFFDEAQYWTWSKQLDFGYYSKPPIVAWVIAFGNAFFGNEAFGIKVGAPLVHGLTALLVYQIAKVLYPKDERYAFWSAITYLLLPGVTASSAFISADVPLMFFWTAGIYCFARAIQREGDHWWAYMAIMGGLGLLSKYTMIVFFPCAVLFLMYTPRIRALLWNVGILSVVAIVILIYFPNFLWNMSNDFISFVHTNDNVFSHGFSVYPLLAAEFFGAQFGVFGPILFVVLLWLLKDAQSLWKEENTRLLLCFTFPLFLLAIAISLASGAQAHWAAPVYISGTLLVVRWLQQKTSRVRWLRSALILHAVILLAFSNFPLLSHHLGSYNPLARITLWNTLAPHAVKALHDNPGTFLLSDERKGVATLMYNLRTSDGEPYTVLKWNPDKTPHDHYDMITNMNDYLGQNFIFVTRMQDVSSVYEHFNSGTEIERFTSVNKEFTVHLLQNFKGY